MRAGLSTILQTLTPDAAAILKQSVSEASRRSHGQTTPLHVAAALLSSPSSLLRLACNQSHPANSHPLQCRALELCFSVALDRLPSDSSPSPSISNALTAALKRAQANQRRGCPEQQQQPLLAVKVELCQLVLSVLDDPSVSRVMREAGFSSPAVKAAVERSARDGKTPPFLPGIGFKTADNGKTPPFLPGMGYRAAAADNCKVSPLLPGIGFKAAAEKPASVADNDKISSFLSEIGIKAFAKKPAAVADSGKTLPFLPGISFKGAADNGTNSSFLSGVGLKTTAEKAAGDDNGKIAPFMTGIGSKSSENNKFPTLLAGFGFKAKPAAPGIPLRNVYANPRLQKEESEETRQAFEVLRRRRQRNPVFVGEVPETAARELIKKIEEKGIGLGVPLRLEIFPVEKAVSASAVQELVDSVDRCVIRGDGAILDMGNLQWLVERAGRGIAAAAVVELKKILARFAESGRVWLVGYSSSATYLRCQGYHPSLELDLDLQPVSVASRPPQLDKASGGGRGSEMCTVCKDSYEKELAKLVAMEFEKSSSGAKPNKPALAPWLQLAKLSSGDSPAATQSQTREQELSWKKTTEELLSRWSETCTRLHSKPRPLDLLPTPPPRPASPIRTDLVLGHQKSSSEKPNSGEMDAFKRIYKALAERVSWQQEAASATAACVARSRPGSRGDTWLLFEGPDLLGKKKMAEALAATLFNNEPITVSFGGAAKWQKAAGFSRGKTGIDRMADVLRRNPFSVFVLDGVDSADALVLTSLRKAAEKGRLTDSHGREVPVGGAVFVLVSGGGAADEKLYTAAHSGWELALSSPESDRPAYPSKRPRLSLDLNLAAAVDDDDSSVITFETGCGDGEWAALRSAIDSAVDFRPVDFGALRRTVEETMARKFRGAVGEGRTLVVDSEAMDVLVGGLWFGSTPPAAFEEWADKVAVPTFCQSTSRVLKLMPVKDGGAAPTNAGLPTRVRVLP